MHHQVLLNLSLNLRGIISQRLVRKEGGGRAAALEIMLNQGYIKELISKGEVKELDYKTILYGATYYLRLYQAIASKWTMNHKITDFAMPEYDFEFFANAAQNIGLISLATQA